MKREPREVLYLRVPTKLKIKLVKKAYTAKQTTTDFITNLLEKELKNVRTKRSTKEGRTN